MISLQELITLAHLFGVILGAGAALVTDVLFFASIYDRKLVRDELRFLTITSKLVWVGLVILFLTGLGLVLLNPGYYLQADKFLAKMTIVTILTLNGFVFHFYHFPFFHKIKNKHIAAIAKDRFRRSQLLLNGIISLTSWISALTLGSLRNLTLTYQQIMSLLTGTR